MQPTPVRIIEMLQLRSPTSCGYVREPYCSRWHVPQSAESADVEIGIADALAAKFPEAREQLAAFTR